MKDITVLFDELIEKAIEESKQPIAMKSSMGVREFLLLNISTSDLHALALAIRHITSEIEKVFMTHVMSDKDMLMQTMPDFQVGGSIGEISEETLMVLTNMTVDYLLNSQPSEYGNLVMEEFLLIYNKLRPAFNDILGDYGEEYTPITFETYTLYRDALKSMETNMEEIREGNLDSLKPLYSPELLNVEDAIDDLYNFTIKLRYDLALIWAIRKKCMKIEPIIEGGVSVDWQIEISSHMSESTTLMLDSVFNESED